MKKFFGMILVAVMMVSILGVAPEKAYAAKGYVEKQVGYDTGTHGASIMCKKFKVVHINIDKVSANDAVKKIYKYGKKGVKDKVAYTILLDTKEFKKGVSSGERAYEKYEAKLKKYAKKVKKASANKYGISMCSQTGSLTANEVIYCEKLFDAILKGKINDDRIQSGYSDSRSERSDEDYDIYNVGDYTVSDLFKSAADIKKLSDSAKYQVFSGSFSDDRTRLKYTQRYSCSYSFELLWKKTIKGACNDFAGMWRYFAEYICDEVKATSVNCSNHTYVMIGVKNSKGNWEYFKGDTLGCTVWWQTKLGTGYSFADKKLGKKALKWAKTSGAYKDWDSIPTDLDKLVKEYHETVVAKRLVEAKAKEEAEAAKEAEYTATVVTPPTTSTWNGVGDNPYYTYE